MAPDGGAAVIAAEHGAGAVADGSGDLGGGHVDAAAVARVPRSTVTYAQPGRAQQSGQIVQLGALGVEGAAHIGGACRCRCRP